MASSKGHGVAVVMHPTGSTWGSKNRQGQLLPPKTDNAAVPVPLERAKIGDVLARFVGFFDQHIERTGSVGPDSPVFIDLETSVETNVTQAFFVYHAVRHQSEGWLSPRMAKALGIAAEGCHLAFWSSLCALPYGVWVAAYPLMRAGTNGLQAAGYAIAAELNPDQPVPAGRHWTSPFKR